MKNLFYITSVFIFLTAGSFSQSNHYSPFSVNVSKSNLKSTELLNSVTDAKIIDVNFDEVLRIIRNREENISLTVPFEGNTLNVELKKFDIINSNTKFVKGTGAGDVIINRINDFVSYTSDLKDINSPLVVITFFKDEISALIITNQDTYVIAKEHSGNDIIAYKTSNLKKHNDFKCTSEELGIPEEITNLQKNLRSNMFDIATSNLLKANIAVESDFELFSFFSGSIERATNYIISLYVPVSAIYTRDVNVKLELTYIRVWSTSADPYPDATSSSTLLNAFRSYWNANMQGTPRTIAHFISTRPGGLGGVAWVDVLCATGGNSYGYAFSDIDGTFNNLPTYSWDCMVVAHETGHNFGSPHTHNCSWPGGPIDSCYTVEGGCYNGPQIPRVGTIMSYCHLNGSIVLYFGPLPSNLIRTKAESAGCMSSITGYLLATPNGGQLFRSSNQTLIIWGTSNSGTVDIDYSSNNGGNWVNIQSNIDASLRNITWTIPYISTTLQARVKVYQSGMPANGDQSDSAFQIRPLMNTFSIFNPPQLYRTNVSQGDTSLLNFSFGKSGTLPEFKYKFTLSILNNSNSFSSFSNNSGHDTVFSITRNRLDSLVNSWGTVNIGDSLRLKWGIRSYTMLDSLSSQNNFLITFIRTVIGIQQISSNIPERYFISPNYPNPFNPETNIKFGLPAHSSVKLVIFDILGKEVVTLINGKLDAGEYNAQWDASSYSSGIYIYKIEAFDIKGNKFTETRKMVLVK